MGELTQDTDVLILGGGPGGYAAAFRAADLGLEVTMIDEAPLPGGECLHRGCIPSKTLLHIAELLSDARNAAHAGVTFQPPRIDLAALRSWKEEVIQKLADGLVNLCEKRSVQLINARAVFEDSGRVRLQGADISHVRFKHAVLATGSRPASLPSIQINNKGRVMDSEGALALADIPENLLVVGGGYIALEMGMVYASLGSRVTLIVRRDRLVRGADPDLVVPLKRRVDELFAAVHCNTMIKDLAEYDSHVMVRLHGDAPGGEQRFERVLIAVGRQPNSSNIGLENTDVKTDDKGFVTVDEQQRSTDPKIFAVGDIAGGQLLAHKAMREGKVAAEVIAGEPSAFDVRAIPAVVYTFPQIAWSGLTEEQARKEKRPIKVSRFPWKFSGRAITMGAPEGLTKVIVDKETDRVLGMGIVGREAEGMITEGTLAVEMGALAQDVALTIHPHPTLSETEAEAFEAFFGSATHILPKQKS